MRSKSHSMSLFIMLLFAFPFAWKNDLPQVNPSMPQSEKRNYVRASNQGTIYGMILFPDEAPKRREIDMSADSACVEVNRNPETEDVIVKDGRLANVFIYVKSAALDEFKFEVPASAAVLEHRKCQYVPHVLGLQVGQTLKVINSDATVHNTNVQARNNKALNISQPPGSEPIVKQFEVPELFIPFRDNQHPWERAWAGVFAHPFFAVSDRDGSYRIEGLPPGSYRVVAWHERYGEKEIEVEIVPGEQKPLNFIFVSNDGW